MVTIHVIYKDLLVLGRCWRAVSSKTVKHTEILVMCPLGVASQKCYGFGTPLSFTGTRTRAFFSAETWGNAVSAPLAFNVPNCKAYWLGGLLLLLAAGRSLITGVDLL